MRTRLAATECARVVVVVVQSLPITRRVVAALTAQFSYPLAAAATATINTRTRSVKMTAPTPTNAPRIQYLVSMGTGIHT